MFCYNFGHWICAEGVEEHNHAQAYHQHTRYQSQAYFQKDNLL